ISAAAASLDRANLEKQRVALTLRDRAATAADQYANAKLMALEYREEILPRAKKAYTLMVEKYGQMLAANPHVLRSQRKLFNLQAEYILALENIWTSGIALQGFLLTDGLESPARPTEVDRPIRETNRLPPAPLGRNTIHTLLTMQGRPHVALLWHIHSWLCHRVFPALVVSPPS